MTMLASRLDDIVAEIPFGAAQAIEDPDNPGMYFSYGDLLLLDESARNALNVYTVNETAIIPAFTLLSYDLVWDGDTSEVNQVYNYTSMSMEEMLVIGKAYMVRRVRELLLRPVRWHAGVTDITFLIDQSTMGQFMFYKYGLERVQVGYWRWGDGGSPTITDPVDGSSVIEGVGLWFAGDGVPLYLWDTNNNWYYLDSSRMDDIFTDTFKYIRGMHNWGQTLVGYMNDAYDQIVPDGEAVARESLIDAITFVDNETYWVDTLLRDDP